MDVNIKFLVNDERCYQVIREMRWLDTVFCPHCDSSHIKKRGFDDTQLHRQRYECCNCSRRFDDLTNTVFAGHHQPLKVWILCLYFMGLNLSNEQIAKELDLDKDDTHDMTTILRNKTFENKPNITLSGEVEFDEVYVVAGHKGQPEAVKKRVERAEETG